MAGNNSRNNQGTLGQTRRPELGRQGPREDLASVAKSPIVMADTHPDSTGAVGHRVAGGPATGHPRKSFGGYSSRLGTHVDRWVHQDNAKYLDGTPSLLGGRTGEGGLGLHVP